MSAATDCSAVRRNLVGMAATNRSASRAAEATSSVTATVSGKRTPGRRRRFSRDPARSRTCSRWWPHSVTSCPGLPQRLKASAQGHAKKGWLHARLTVQGSTDARGYGLLGSSVFVANPPHTLAAALRKLMPLLAKDLGQDSAAGWVVEEG